MNVNKTQNIILILLSTLTLIGLPFSLKVSTSAMYLFLIFSIFLILKNKKLNFKSSFIILGISFFLLHGLHLIIDENPKEHIFEITKKLIFLFLPFIWLNLPISEIKKYKNKTFLFFSYGLSLIGLCLLISATIKYINTGNINVYFYHEFDSLFNVGAIYLSLLFCFSLVIIFINYQSKSSLGLLFLGSFNFLIIILLSSKIFVIILVMLIVFYSVRISNFKSKFPLFFLGLLGIIGVTNSNNFASRFNDLEFSNFFNTKDVITQNTSFDGFTFRKELVRFGVEIGFDNPKSILLGVGPGFAQDKLDDKFIKSNFYLGNGTEKDTGFLGYNFHNQYIQTFVEIGVFGLLILILILVYLINEGIKTKNYYLIFFNLIFAILFFTESVLSRQIGVFSFLFFNLIALQSNDHFNYSNKLIIKRVFDILFSIFVIVLILSWLFPFLCIIVFFDTKSYPIFKQKGIGMKGVEFSCYKFRTMIKNYESDKVAAIIDDKRVTKIGAILRKYALDELPQFYNVLKGEMSVVGARPLMTFEENKFNELIPNFSSRLILKPGITGLSQSNGYKGFMRDSHDVVIRYRIDKLYVKKQSFMLDINIIIQTVLYIFKQ